MAKTIEEILKDLQEWQEENPELSVMIIAGAEEEDIFFKQKGEKSEILTCMASAIETCSKVEDLITEAMDIVKKYRKEKQQDEDN